MVLCLMRKVPRPFKMPWGNGMVVKEVSITSQYHEPTVQLLQFDNGNKRLGSVPTTKESLVEFL